MTTLALLWKFRAWIGAGLAICVALGLWAIWTQRGRDLTTTKAQLVAEQAAFEMEHQAFLAEQRHSRALEAARGQEHASAVQDASDAGRACSARVATARKSASAITRTLNEPPHANPNPAEPELIPDSVWDGAPSR